MSQENRKSHKFQIGDRVHVLNPPNQQWLYAQRGQDLVLPPTPVTLASPRSQAARGSVLSSAVGNSRTLSTNLTSSTIYVVTSVNDAVVSGRSPTYTLCPAEPLTINATEADIFPAVLSVNDIVIRKDQVGARDAHLRIVEIRVEVAGDLLPGSKHSCYGASGAIADDGEYEVIDSPFRTARRTSLSNATLEERVKVRVAVVDRLGRKQIMDADDLEKTPEGSEWSIAVSDEFIGQ